jgi:hypothetical protein
MSSRHWEAGPQSGRWHDTYRPCDWRGISNNRSWNSSGWPGAGWHGSGARRYWVAP